MYILPALRLKIDIFNPMLRTVDGISFKSVDYYQLHQLITAITEGLESTDATTLSDTSLSTLQGWCSIGETQLQSTSINL
jgi:hypothetical protein